MSVTQIIREAEKLLPGKPSADGDDDPRWLAMIEVASHIEVQPEPVWEFIVKWGVHPQRDLRAAVACCLLEHLLEHHFAAYFPRVRKLVLKEPLFAETFTWCWKFGQSEEPENAEQFDKLICHLKGPGR